MADKTLGENRVRTDFNVDGNDAVTQIKRMSAELIDLCETLKNDDGERNRLVAIAQHDIEQAAMWAVKAATA